MSKGYLQPLVTHARSGMSLNVPAVFTHARSGMSLNLPAVFTQARSGMSLNLPAVFLFTHARSGMSLNLPAVFLFLFIIFCVAIVHFRFMALAPLFPRSTQYLLDFRFVRMT